MLDPNLAEQLSPVLITGATGQDGRIAARLLADQGCQVSALYRSGRRTDPSNTDIASWYEWDWTSADQVKAILDQLRPNCVLHFAAHHHGAADEVIDRLADEKEMVLSNLSGPALLLSAMTQITPKASFVAAASSQMYTANQPAQRIGLTAPINPSTYYGAAKAAFMTLTSHHRATSLPRACTAVLFNHESIFRPANFITRSISQGAAAIKVGDKDKLHLRNIGAGADWSSAEDTVKAVVQMALTDQPNDFIVASGKPTAVKDLLDAAFQAVDLDWRDYVVAERDAETPFLVGDIEATKQELNWSPRVSVEATMVDMVHHDLQILSGRGC